MSQAGHAQAVLDHLRTPLYRNAYALIASNLLSSVLGIVYWSLAARLYRVDELGQSAAVISTMLFLSGVAQLNLRMALIRLVPEAGPRTARLVWTAYLLSLAVTGIVGLVVFLVLAATGSAVLAPSGLATAGGVAFLVVSTMVWTLFNLQDGVLAGLRRTLWVPVENGLYGVAKIALLVGLVVAMPSLGILVSWFVPMALAVLLVTSALAWRWIPAHEAASPGRALAMGRATLLRFVAADYVGSLFALAVTSLLPVLIVAASGARDGAYFYIVWTISTSLNLLPVNMAASMTVETIHAEADLGVATRRVAIHMARALVPMVLVVVVFGDWILQVFGPDYASGGATSLRLLAVGVLPCAVNTLYLATLRIHGRGRQIMIVQAVLAALTLGGSLLLIGPLQITGVALAWLIAQSSVAAVVGLGRVWPLISSARVAERAGSSA